MMMSGNVAFNTVTGLTTNSQMLAAPGVCAFNWSPTLGSPVAATQAAHSKYSFVVHANSRNQSYDAPDLMIMILAGKEVFCEIAELIRAYGIMQMYDQRNRYLPTALLEACGFNPADLRANYSHMLWDINNLIAQSQQIWVPDDMPLIEREFWMCSHIYMDSESVKGQYYVYNKFRAFKFSATGSAQGSSLVQLPEIKYCQSLMTWGQAVARVQALINAIVPQQDRGIMFGDILKAYGSDKIYRLNMISADYTVEPVYDAEVLSQMSNVICSGNIPKSVQQSGGSLIEVWESVQNTPAITNMIPTEAVLNLHVKGQPTPEAVLVATRMMVLGNHYTVSGQPAALDTFKPSTYGTEVCASMSMCVYVNSGLVWNSYSSNMISSSNGADALTRIFLATAFDWCPAIYTAQSSGVVLPTPGSPVGIIHPYQFILDMENYIWLDTPTLERMHETACLSEYGVPVDLS